MLPLSSCDLKKDINLLTGTADHIQNVHPAGIHAKLTEIRIDKTGQTVLFYDYGIGRQYLTQTRIKFSVAMMVQKVSIKTNKTAHSYD